MKVLVIGSGGREHALAWKLSQSSLADKIFCAPGNAGIAQNAECLNINVDDTDRLLEFAKKEKIDLTVVGPEAPLANGIVDEFSRNELFIFGPSRKAAKLEASKVFAKQLMAKYAVPTADFEIFDDPQSARKYIEKKGFPLVIKADGLAQGKGVVIAQSREQAFSAIKSMMEDKAFGSAGKTVIVEECLQGQEASILVIVDAHAAIPLATSQDHKRVFDNDQGPNTGGMGAYSPAPVVSSALQEQIQKTIVSKTLQALAKEGIEYNGVLYVGIMITKSGPMVLEYNVRFGDPETQAILPRLQTDLLEIMSAASRRQLNRFTHFTWDSRACVCVVCASRGYPADYEKGKEIFGLEDLRTMKDIAVFHAGTKIDPTVQYPQPKPQQPRYVTSGGRVLGVAGLGDSITDAIEKTYRAVNKIKFDGMHYRSDIGKKAFEN